MFESAPSPLCTLFSRDLVNSIAEGESRRDEPPSSLRRASGVVGMSKGWIGTIGTEGEGE